MGFNSAFKGLTYNSLDCLGVESNGFSFSVVPDSSFTPSCAEQDDAPPCSNFSNL